MTKIKNTKQYNAYVKYINSNKDNINEIQNSEIEISEKMRVKTVDLTINTIMLNNGATKGEINKSKELANNTLNIHAYSKTRIDLAFRIAGSTVIKQLLKDCTTKESIEKKLLEVCNCDKLSQTSINTYKNKNSIDEKGNIKEKVKKNKVKSEKPVEKKEKKLNISKMTRDELISQISMRKMEIELMQVQLNKLNQESIDVKKVS